jgi:hypothetical protein
MKTLGGNSGSPDAPLEFTVTNAEQDVLTPNGDNVIRR